MAAILALSGDVRFNPETDTLTGTDGTVFKFNPPQPPAMPGQGLTQVKGTFTPPLEEGSQVEIKINPSSERLELLKPFDPWDGKDFIDLPVLVKTSGKTTTDHISPGGKWLRFRGHLTNISENLLEGASNAFTGETGRGTNVLTGEKGKPLSELAKIYKTKTGGSVIIGDDNYGEGSSREHAAMSPRFLGVKVVIARSFARILSFLELANLKPSHPIKGIIKKQNSSTNSIEYTHTLTEEQIKWFYAGSALNTMRE